MRRRLWRGLCGGVFCLLALATVLVAQQTGPIGTLRGATDTAQRLLVSMQDAASGIYTEGDTDASITGSALMLEGAGDALVAAPGSATDGLLVNLGANNTVVAHMVSLFVDDADFTDGTSTHMLDGCVAESASPTTVTEGDTGACGMTLNRAQKVTLYNSSGTELTSGDATHDSTKATSGPQAMAAAVAHGADPTAATAGDAVNWIANRDGVPFVLGGHPNLVTIEAQIQDADGALTDQDFVTASAGTKIVVTGISAHCDGSTTAPTNIAVGFGDTVPAGAHTGTAKVLARFDGVPAGGSYVKGFAGGIIGIGGDGDDVVYTSEDPAGGNCSIEMVYFTIES